MENTLNFILAFDFANKEQNSTLPAIQNAIEVKLPVHSISPKDVVLMRQKIERFVQELTVSEGVNHLFFQIPNTDKLGRNNSLTDKSPEQPFEYRCFRIENLKSHNIPEP
ncbi:MAG: hypothetical protein RR256_06750 [Bacteroidales bacterium]